MAYSPHFSCVPCWDVNISGMICCHLHRWFWESSCWEVNEQILLCILMWEALEYFLLRLCSGQQEVGWSLLRVPGSGWAPQDTGITCSQFGSPQSCGSCSLLFVLWPFPADWHWSFMHQIDDLLWLTFWDGWIWINLGKNISIFLPSNNALLFQKCLLHRGHGQIKSSFDWDSAVEESEFTAGKGQNWDFSH